jgi:uncharacterized peroxidase-related enzyme
MAIPVHERDTAGNESLAEIERKTGPSNFFRAMSHRPEAMKEFARLYATVMGTGSIEHRLKEMVYVAVSSVNECDYCEAHHAQTAHRAGLSEKEIDDISEETDMGFSPKERISLHYARDLTRTASTDGETRNELENLFSAEQLVELTLVIALANFTNRFNNGLAIPLEKESHRTAS